MRIRRGALFPTVTDNLERRGAAGSGDTVLFDGPAPDDDSPPPSVKKLQQIKQRKTRYGSRHHRKGRKGKRP